MNGYEIADMKLLSTPKGYYMRFTVFIDKNKINDCVQIEEPIGIDFGCGNSFNFSNGEKINVKIEETERLKRLQKNIANKIKGSNNYNKIKKLIGIEHQKITNRKTDIANKLVSKIKKHKLVVIQDEQLQNWHKSRPWKSSSAFYIRSS